MPPQLALELADVDPCAFEQCLLLCALQPQASLVDASDIIAFLDDRARLGDHHEASGDAGGNLDLVATVNRSGHGHGRRNLGLRYHRDLNGPGRHLLGMGPGRGQEQNAGKG